MAQYHGKPPTGHGHEQPHGSLHIQPPHHSGSPPVPPHHGSPPVPPHHGGTPPHGGSSGGYSQRG